MNGEEDNNEIIIADKDIRLYLGICAINFQRFNQLVLSAGESFVEKQRTMSSILAAVGIEIEEKYLSSNNKIKFITEETEIINDKSGKREKRFFHKLGITKIPDLFQYTKEDEDAIVPTVNDNISPIEQYNISGNNEIIIAERDIRLYLGQCLMDFQRFDSLVLSAGSDFVEKQRYIAKILAGLGIVVEKPYRAEKGIIRDVTDEVEILNERTGRREIKTCHKLGITKVPELCMYWHDNKLPTINEVQEKAITKKKR